MQRTIAAGGITGASIGAIAGSEEVMQGWARGLAPRLAWPPVWQECY